MELKILSLNLWRFYGNWEERKINILKNIQENKPDLIFLQECFDDGRQGIDYKNQAKILNEELKYSGCNYSIAEMLLSEGGVPLKTTVFDGLGMISNLKIKSVNEMRLKKHETDRHFRIIQRIVLEKDNKEIIVYHTHFSNKEDLSKWHLEETIVMAKKESNLPIILGDLNILNPQVILNLTSDLFESSYTFKPYISLPSKKEVLDYVLIPKNKFKFLEVDCQEEGLSDHSPLYVKLEYNSE